MRIAGSLLLVAILGAVSAQADAESWLEKKARQIAHVPEKTGEVVGKAVGGDAGKAIQAITSAPALAVDMVVDLDTSKILKFDESEQRKLQIMILTGPPPLTENSDAPSDADGGTGEDDTSPEEVSDEPTVWESFLDTLTDEAWGALVEWVIGGPPAWFLEASSPARIGIGDDGPQGYKFPGCIECSGMDDSNIVAPIPIEPDTTIDPPP